MCTFTQLYQKRDTVCNHRAVIYPQTAWLLSCSSYAFRHQRVDLTGLVAKTTAEVHQQRDVIHLGRGTSRPLFYLRATYTSPLIGRGHVTTLKGEVHLARKPRVPRCAGHDDLAHYIYGRRIRRP